MIAWVEMKLVDTTGFDCSKCPLDIQKARECHTDVWERATEKHPGKVWPRKISKIGTQHYFCPARVFRDDPEFVAEMDLLWLSWKLGQVPNGKYIGSISIDDFETMATMIQHWEQIQRLQDFEILGKMLGGGGGGQT